MPPTPLTLTVCPVARPWAVLSKTTGVVEETSRINPDFELKVTGKLRGLKLDGEPSASINLT